VPSFKVGVKGMAEFAAFTDHVSRLPHSGTLLAQLSADVTGDDCSKGSLRGIETMALMPTPVGPCRPDRCDAERSW